VLEVLPWRVREQKCRGESDLENRKLMVRLEGSSVWGPECIRLYETRQDKTKQHKVASINEQYNKASEKLSCSEVLGRASDSPEPPSRTGKVRIPPAVVGVQGAPTDVERCHVEADFTHWA
jgi:hypothetical protein